MRIRELRGLAQHAKERGLAQGIGGGRRGRTGRAKGPLRKITARLASTDDRCKVQLSCGHELWADVRAIYQARCWLCARIERGECLKCSAPLVCGVCPNVWDGTGGLVPPRGKHA